jgi:putative transcriptional regulator
MADWEGRLLVATPVLTEDTFARTVVQLLAYDAQDGAFGVVLTRSTETPLVDVLPGWALLAPDPAYVFDGGPVQESAAVCVAQVAPTDAEPQGYVLVPGTPRLATVDLDGDAASEIEQVRVFAGYAGWSPGQLEAEVEQGAWWVVDGLPSDVFTDRPDQLWRRVLRRQGAPLAFAATYPGDPGLN